MVIQYGRNETGFSISPRPEQAFTIRKCGRNEWSKFRRYHYLDTELANSAQCHGLYHGDKIIGFIGVLHFPHPHNAKIKRVSRLVILPDYQGIGIGTAFLRHVGAIYSDAGFDFRITSSAKNVLHSLNKSPNWKLERYSRYSEKTKTVSDKALGKSARLNVKTASFKYIGGKS